MAHVDSVSVVDAEAVDQFEVNLEEFSGPFDVLLSLIAKHKLEVTALALHQVTDDFCSYIREQGHDWDLDETTSFLVVAATLLDLKAARLLPSGEVDDEEDLALLEARDLLFARLLQYRAFKEVSGVFQQQIAAHSGRYPRVAGMDPEFRGIMPELVFTISPDDFAVLAAGALRPKPAAEVSIDHIHSAPVSVAEQGLIVADRLRSQRQASFRALVSDAEHLQVIVARFLCLLELYRQGVVVFEQVSALADLHVRWVGDDDQDVAADIVSEFDEFVGVSEEAPATEVSA